MSTYLLFVCLDRQIEILYRMWRCLWVCVIVMFTRAGLLRSRQLRSSSGDARNSCEREHSGNATSVALYEFNQFQRIWQCHVCPKRYAAYYTIKIWRICRSENSLWLWSPQVLDFLKLARASSWITNFTVQPSLQPFHQVAPKTLPRVHRQSHFFTASAPAIDVIWGHRPNVHFLYSSAQQYKNSWTLMSNLFKLIIKQNKLQKINAKIMALNVLSRQYHVREVDGGSYLPCLDRQQF